MTSRQRCSPSSGPPAVGWGPHVSGSSLSIVRNRTAVSQRQAPGQKLPDDVVPGPDSGQEDLAAAFQLGVPPGTLVHLAPQGGQLSATGPAAGMHARAVVSEARNAHGEQSDDRQST